MTSVTNISPASWDSAGAAAAAQAAAEATAAADATSKVNAHANSDGSSHTFIDQSTVIGAEPDLKTSNMAGPPGGPNLVTPPSLGADWEVVSLLGGRIVAEHKPGTVADLISSPGSLIFNNADHLAGASAASDEVTTQHDAVTDDVWWSGTYSSETDSVVIPRFPGVTIESEMHIALPDAASMVSAESCGVLVALGSPPAGSQYTAIHALKSGAVYYLQATYGPHTGGDAANSSLNGEDVAKFVTGYWLRTVIRPDGQVQHGYYRGSAAARPALGDYAWLPAVSSIFYATDSQLSVGFKNVSTSAVPNPTGQRLVRTGWRITYSDTVSLV